jgi:hypothetical protein
MPSPSSTPAPQPSGAAPANITADVSVRVGALVPSGSSFSVNLLFSNRGNEPRVISYDLRDVTMTDDLGHIYPLSDVGAGVQQATIQPGQRDQNLDLLSPATDTPLSPAATRLKVTFQVISSMPNIVLVWSR